MPSAGTNELFAGQSNMPNKPDRNQELSKAMNEVPEDQHQQVLNVPTELMAEFARTLIRKP